MLWSRCCLLLAGLSAMALVGCQTADRYEIVYRDPTRVVVQLDELPLAGPVLLDDPAPSASARLEVDPRERGGASYALSVAREASGRLILRFDPALGAPMQRPLLSARGVVLPQLYDERVAREAPGFHLAGLQPGPQLAPSKDVSRTHSLRLLYRPDADTQALLRRTPNLTVSLLTPLDNVRSVTRIEQPHRLGYAALFGVAIATTLAGVFALWPHDFLSREERATWRQVGVPFLLVGVGGGAWSAVMFSRPERRITIPPSEAIVLP